MLSLKKVYRDELLQLALILSLLKLNPDCYLENELFNNDGLELELYNGTSWRYISSNLLRTNVIHRKNLDSVLLNYERELIADLNSLGRYNHVGNIQQNITAYLLNVDRTANGNAPSNQENSVEIPNVQNQQENSEILNDSNNNIEHVALPNFDIELTQEVCFIRVVSIWIYFVYFLLPSSGVLLLNLNCLMRH